MNEFKTIFEECKKYKGFNTKKNNYVADYNIFMAELETEAEKNEDFDYDKFQHFLYIWTWNAKKAEIDWNAPSKEKFLNQVYGAYNRKTPKIVLM